MKKLFTCFLMVLCAFVCCRAADITITMNAVTDSMALRNKVTNEEVVVGDKVESPNHTYRFSADPGEYILSGYQEGKDVANGTIELTITEDPEQSFSFFTVTAGATNAGWILTEDYTVIFEVQSRQGVRRTVTRGESATENRITFMVYQGDTYYLQFIPEESRAEEGYVPYDVSATITANVTRQAAIPMGYPYTITVPEYSSLFVGKKFTHFTTFTEVMPVSSSVSGGNKVYEFNLARSQAYNFRVSAPGKLTNAGTFTPSANNEALEVTGDQMEYADPQFVDHDVKSNGGYNVGDILLNINEKGHLKLSKNEDYQLLCMRSWELTDNVINNYFIEPDFHFTVINENGEEDNNVVSVNEKGLLTVHGEGTAIVLVTYDAIYLSTHLGGPLFSAIWPENTGVFVVTAGYPEAGITSNMTVNENLNQSTSKLSGNTVDAEHDVFYYPEDTEGFDYTFSPEGVANVTLAYSVIGENAATYKGFGNEGVTKNDDGSYTVKLKHGRNIVKMISSAGASSYQVLTAKPVGYELSNVSNPGEQIQPGDQVAVKFSTLYHPANKLAGVYNMAASIYYHDMPEGSSFTRGGSQYTFASMDAAQTITITVPQDWDASKEFIAGKGTILVSGFGDPIGSHRTISPVAGRSPNFNAISHTTYCAVLPDIPLQINETHYYSVIFEGLPDEAELIITDSKSNALTPEEGRTYKQSFGSYDYLIKCAGYEAIRGNYSISSESPGSQVIQIEMIEAGANAWDGNSLVEPARVTAEESAEEGGRLEGLEGWYKITGGAELAWLANQTNTGINNHNAILLNDINLAGYDWTSIGGSNSANQYQGSFDGNNHTIEGLYMVNAAIYQGGLFGYINGAEITNLSVKGTVTGTANYLAGIVARATGSVVIDNCHNYVDVTAGSYSGGVLGGFLTGTLTLTNCSNYGNINTTGTNVGGVAGYITGSASSIVCNLQNYGDLTGQSTIAGVCGDIRVDNLTNVVNHGNVTATGSNYVGGITGYFNGLVSNAYNTGAIITYGGSEYGGGILGMSSTGAQGSQQNTYVTDENYRDGATLKDLSAFASGEVSHLLGEAFGQKIGEELYPVIGSDRVYKVTYVTGESAEEETLYVNTTLPDYDESGYHMVWYTEKDGAIVTEVTEDASLYLELLKAVTGILLNEDELKLLIGDTSLLVATITPEDAANQSYSWTSENEAIASVNADGLVTAVEEGETVITVTTEDGGYTAVCRVNVTKGTGLENVGISVRIYPNPVQDQLNIDNGGVVIEKLIISDASGKVVYKNPVNASSYSLHVNDWAKGTYLIQLISGDGSKTYKVVKI